MSDIAIRVENLSKQYRIGTKEIQHDTLMSAAVAWVKSPLDNFRQLRRLSSFKNGDEADVLWALRDVSFKVKQGEVIGIIGRNGAGKSTLLKILSRITPPSSGRITLNGRVASLLEVGTGFHPELTGRENIYLNGTILGMTKTEVDKRFDEIVDFSGVEKFIDTPVKRYSSGMKVRLAFSVAAHLEPEILLVDEVLAVGDIEFQNKCLGKMSAVANSGRTILFVSHNMAAIQNLCLSCLLLERGIVEIEGATSTVISHYLSTTEKNKDNVLLVERLDRRGNGKMKFTDIAILDDSKTEIAVSQTGQPLIIKISYIASEGAINKNAVVLLKFTNQEGSIMFACLTRSSFKEMLKLSKTGTIECCIPKLPLLPGRYSINIWCKLNEELADEIENAFTLDVIAGDFFGTGKVNSDNRSGLLVDHVWNMG